VQVGSVINKREKKFTLSSLSFLLFYYEGKAGIKIVFGVLKKLGGVGKKNEYSFPHFLI